VLGLDQLRGNYVEALDRDRDSVQVAAEPPRQTAPAGGDNQEWTAVIEPGGPLLSLPFRDIWSHRDLLLILVRRDYIAFYAQTLLGPLWFFIQPLLTMGMYVLVFRNIAGIKTDPVPAPLFYVTGIVVWNYFADCLGRIASVFRENSNIFGKVYFPRLIIPISIVMSSLVRFGVQMILVISTIAVYALAWGYPVRLNLYTAIIPLGICLLALYSLALGVITAAVTVKYRDAAYLVNFGLQLYMYASPVVYPLNYPQSAFVRRVISLNPMSPIIESIRIGMLGYGDVNWVMLVRSFIVIVGAAFVGLVLFNKAQRDCVDTI
jgi:lipopolysaccharide transport system permease protein